MILSNILKPVAGNLADRLTVRQNITDHIALNRLNQEALIRTSIHFNRTRSDISVHIMGHSDGVLFNIRFFEGCIKNMRFAIIKNVVIYRTNRLIIYQNIIHHITSIRNHKCLINIGIHFDGSHNTMLCWIKRDVARHKTAWIL